MVTVTQLTTLEAALASGTTRVTYNGRSVEYGTVDNLLKAIQYIKSELAGQAGIVSSRQVRTYTSKGLGPTNILLDGFE